MQVKVDFSKDCKANNYDVTRPGCYAIYTRAHFWNEWKEGQRYASMDFAFTDAKRFAGLPKYF